MPAGISFGENALPMNENRLINAPNINPISANDHARLAFSLSCLNCGDVVGRYTRLSDRASPGIRANQSMRRHAHPAGMIWARVANHSIALREGASKQDRGSIQLDIGEEDQRGLEKIVALFGQN